MSKTKKLLKGAAIIALLSSTLTACVSSPAAPESKEAPKSITVAIPNVSPPYIASSQANTALRITSNVFDPLIFMDPKTGALSPGIATKWEYSDDTKLDLTIREGVKFHDGTPLTADDVAFTLSSERLWGKKPLEPTGLATTFAAVDVINAQTVRITTKQPDPAILKRLASVIGFVVPKKLIQAEGIDAFGLNPVGTGPYKVTSVAPGEKVELSANGDYWGEKPTYEKVTFREVQEVSARVSGLATGEYNIVTNLPPDQTGVVQTNGQRMTSVRVNNMVSLAFMTAKTSSPIADPRIRQAFELAVDRKGINDSLWAGEVETPDGFNLPTYNGFYDADSKPSGQDVNKAKDLLKEAGYSGAPIVLRYVSGLYTNMDKALEAMLEMWTQAGLNVQLRGVSDFTLLDYKTLDVYATSSNISLADPISPMWTDWVSPTSVYISQGRGAVSRELTAAVTELSTSLDTAKRKDAYLRATKLWDEELPAMTVWQPLDIYGIGDGITMTADPRYWMRLTTSQSN